MQSTRSHEGSINQKVTPRTLVPLPPKSMKWALVSKSFMSPDRVWVIKNPSALSVCPSASKVNTLWDFSPLLCNSSPSNKGHIFLSTKISSSIHKTTGDVQHSLCQCQWTCAADQSFFPLCRLNLSLPLLVQYQLSIWFKLRKLTKLLHLIVRVTFLPKGCEERLEWRSNCTLAAFCTSWTSHLKYVESEKVNLNINFNLLICSSFPRKLRVNILNSRRLQECFLAWKARKTRTALSVCVCVCVDCLTSHPFEGN